MKTVLATLLLFATIFLASCQKEDSVTPISGVKINKTSLTLTVGGKEALTATISPETVTNKSVIWSSNNSSVATVSESGEIVAISAGTATITVASVVDKSKTATCQVTVLNPTVAINEVTLNRTTLALLIGEKEILVSTVLPDNASDKSVSWASSNPEVATVAENGEVVALSIGTTTVTVKSIADVSKTATCVVTVTKSIVEITDVQLNKKTLSLLVGAKETLISTVLPDNATDKSVTWTSSNPEVVTVSSTGEVSAIKAGTATITVAAIDNKAKLAICIVTITNPKVEVAEVKLNKPTLSLVVGTKETLVSTVLPDNAPDKSVTWTSNNTNVATVSAEGEVVAVSAGTAKITVISVSDQTKSATCEVTVTAEMVAVTEVKLNKQTLALIVGAKEALTSTVLPNNATDKSVTWKSSNQAVATVSTDGEIVAISAGTATITMTSVSDKTKSATCEVTVTNAVIAVTEVKLNKSTISLTTGAKETLVSTVLPNNATDKSVTWKSSNEAVATVSSTGEVSAISVGNATITATSVSDNTKTATCTITVTKPTVAVTLVGINNKPLSLLIGGKATLLVSVLPDNATDKSVTWTSNNTSVATVSQTGEVTAVGTGFATITVTSVSDNTKTDECKVTVNAPVVTTAEIGNFYYSDNTQTKILDKTKSCVGIVFWVDPSNNQKGKVVSLDEQELAWSDKLELTGVKNNTNGRANMYQLNQFVNASTNSVWDDYPAFNWVATVKNKRAVGGWAETDMWYLPAQGDLVILFGSNGSTMITVNTSLNSVQGAVALTPSLYCSSTEANDTNAIFVSFASGVSQDIFKVSAEKVRAIAAF